MTDAERRWPWRYELTLQAGVLHGWGRRGFSLNNPTSSVTPTHLPVERDNPLPGDGRGPPPETPPTANLTDRFTPERNHPCGRTPRNAYRRPGVLSWCCAPTTARPEWGSTPPFPSRAGTSATCPTPSRWSGGLMPSPSPCRSPA